MTSLLYGEIGGSQLQSWQIGTSSSRLWGGGGVKGTANGPLPQPDLIRPAKELGFGPLSYRTFQLIWVAVEGRGKG